MNNQGLRHKLYSMLRKPYFHSGLVFTKFAK